MKKLSFKELLVKYKVIIFLMTLVIIFVSIMLSVDATESKYYIKTTNNKNYVKQIDYDNYKSIFNGDISYPNVQLSEKVEYKNEEIKLDKYVYLDNKMSSTKVLIELADESSDIMLDMQLATVNNIKDQNLAKSCFDYGFKMKNDLKTGALTNIDIVNNSNSIGIYTDKGVTINELSYIKVSFFVKMTMNKKMITRIKQFENYEFIVQVKNTDGQLVDLDTYLYGDKA